MRYRDQLLGVTKLGKLPTCLGNLESWGKWWGPLGMVPLIINPIYTLYNGYLLGISPMVEKGLSVSKNPTFFCCLKGSDYEKGIPKSCLKCCLFGKTGESLSWGKRWDAFSKFGENISTCAEHQYALTTMYSTFGRGAIRHG